MHFIPLIEPFDGKNPHQETDYEQLTGLRTKYPHLKVSFYVNTYNLLHYMNEDSKYQFITHNDVFMIPFILYSQKK